MFSKTVWEYISIMNEKVLDMGSKKLMEGYVGVKFKAIQLPGNPPVDITDYYPHFKSVCDRLRDNDMTDANAGNMSCRYDSGYIITSTGSNLGSLEKDELVCVERCDVEAEEVYYFGPKEPSSETLMHWLIYSERPETNAIMHAHDEMATRSDLLSGRVEETEREEPYGSLALARLALKTLKGGKKIIVLKNHGYVAIGQNLEMACEMIVQMHHSLLSSV